MLSKRFAQSKGPNEGARGCSFGTSGAAGGLAEGLWWFELLAFFPNFWRFFGKLWEARSRLYRNESLQVNSRWKALDEIYKIYKLLHRSAFKNSAKFRQACSHFCSFIFKSSLIFRNFCSTFTNFDEHLPEFQQIWRTRSTSRFSNFLRFRAENYWIFQKVIVEKT